MTAEDQISFVFPEMKTYNFMLRIDEGEEKGIHGATIDAYNLKEAQRALKHYYPEARTILVLVN